MTPDLRKEREIGIYEATLRLIGSGQDPMTMKVQQIAEAAGIGKGTVYEYFSSKEEILRGVALHSFDTEIVRVRSLMARCMTLEDLEEAVTTYLSDLMQTRMAAYRVIAGNINTPDAGMASEVARRIGELRAITGETVDRLRQAGRTEKTLDRNYCDLALFCAALGGLVCLSVGQCSGIASPEGILTELRKLLHRALQPLPTGNT